MKNLFSPSPTIISKTVILTNGTFLNGLIHVGEKQFGGGRVGEKASFGITENLTTLGFVSGRMKTGTPPRVDGRSLNYNKMQEQPGDANPGRFSYLPSSPVLTNQRSCYVTYTNVKTHDLLREGFDRSPMFNGRIKSVGPRYCPSVEDKISRFSEKDRHQIFVEPEGWNTVEVYVNGFSTSLPEEIQYKALKSVPGFEDVKFFRPGYAIEYDYFPPTQLNYSLETKLVENLFFAGQINGTTGYEEAAAQGLIAGINASINLNTHPKWFTLDRSEAYIGVMIDDLISKGAPEPYRMFTSRAEFRLLLRSDNADQRLTDKGLKFGIIGTKRQKLWEAKRQNLKNSYRIIDNLSAKPSLLKKYNLPSTRTGNLRSPKDILSSGKHFIKDLFEIWPDLKTIPVELHSQIETDCIYNVYLKRQKEDIKMYRQENKTTIPINFNFNLIKGLSNEIKDILKKNKPSTVAQASSLPGFTPTATLLLLRHLKQEKKYRIVNEY